MIDNPSDTKIYDNIEEVFSHKISQRRSYVFLEAFAQLVETKFFILKNVYTCQKLMKFQIDQN